MNITAPSIDLLLVNAPGKKRVYQQLADQLAAFEPPVWAGLIANYIRRRGFSVRILDAEALSLSTAETVDRIIDERPRLTVFVVYGQQPSASTQSMPAACDVCRLLRDRAPQVRTLLMGTHPSALPRRTMAEEAVDFVCEGEGPVTILNLLQGLRSGGLNARDIRGLWFREDGAIIGNPREPKIMALDQEFGGMAWDLLPMDRYRAHNWHCWAHINDRKPYASLYTSLGCPYRCSFCCINAPFGESGIRYFSPETILHEIDILVTRYGVKNIKIADEMYVLNPRHVMKLADLIIDRGYKLNIWAYARVDTVKDEYLEKMKRAGWNWLAIGVESGSKFVRDGADKGRFSDEDIMRVIEKVRSYDISVGANYIFGLPDDTLESMQTTLDLALRLNTEYANFYCAMAYPGSPLHEKAMEKGLPLPENPPGPGWIGYSQHAYETYPLPTDTVPAGEVLAFRDRAFSRYFTDSRYLDLIEVKFGLDARNHIGFMTSHKLERKYAAPSASAG